VALLAPARQPASGTQTKASRHIRDAELEDGIAFEMTTPVNGRVDHFGRETDDTWAGA